MNELNLRYDTVIFEKNSTSYIFQLKDGGINADKINLSTNDILCNNVNNLPLRYGTTEFHKNSSSFKLELKSDGVGYSKSTISPTSGLTSISDADTKSKPVFYY